MVNCTLQNSYTISQLHGLVTVDNCRQWLHSWLSLCRVGDWWNRSFVVYMNKSEYTWIWEKHVMRTINDHGHVVGWLYTSRKTQQTIIMTHNVRLPYPAVPFMVHDIGKLVLKSLGFPLFRHQQFLTRWIYSFNTYTFNTSFINYVIFYMAYIAYIICFWSVLLLLPVSFSHDNVIFFRRQYKTTRNSYPVSLKMNQIKSKKWIKSKVKKESNQKF